jgi:hypothetical protein
MAGAARLGRGKAHAALPELGANAGRAHTLQRHEASDSERRRVEEGTQIKELGHVGTGELGELRCADGAEVLISEGGEGAHESLDDVLRHLVVAVCLQLPYALLQQHDELSAQDETAELGLRVDDGCLVDMVGVARDERLVDTHDREACGGRVRWGVPRGV